MTIWTNATGLVIQADPQTYRQPVTLPGCKTYPLDAGQSAAFSSLLPQGNVLFDGKSFTTQPVASVPIVDPLDDIRRRISALELKVGII